MPTEPHRHKVEKRLKNLNDMRERFILYFLFILSIFHSLRVGCLRRIHSRLSHVRIVFNLEEIQLEFLSQRTISYAMLKEEKLKLREREFRFRSPAALANQPTKEKKEKKSIQHQKISP
jgi:hypothetical protein